MTTKECVPEGRNNPETAKSPSKSKQRITKRDQLIRLLSGRHGISAVAISKKLNWQPHTTRAALSGLRKSGIVIEKVAPSNGGPTRYHIGENPDMGARQ